MQLSQPGLDPAAPKGQPVAQSPEHNEADDVRRILRPIQHPSASLVELLAEVAATEATMAMGRAVGPLCHRLRSAAYAIPGERSTGHSTARTLTVAGTGHRDLNMARIQT
jgi:hypothetical protein